MRRSRLLKKPYWVASAAFCFLTSFLAVWTLLAPPEPETGLDAAMAVLVPPDVAAPAAGLVDAGLWGGEEMRLRQSAMRPDPAIFNLDRGYETSANPVALAAPRLPAIAKEFAPLPPAARPRIAIVIDDVGPNYREAKRLIALPAPITLAFLPYAERLDELTRQAAKAGHSLIVHVPMEPHDLADNNPGPTPVLVGLRPDDMQARVTAALESFSGHVGINNHMGSAFTENEAGMRLVLSELARRDLLFLDSRTTPKSVAAAIAAELGMKFVARDVFLDNVMDATAIAAQLAETERIARRRGYAVAIGHPYPVTLDVLARWLPEAEQRGFTLVPIQQLARRAQP